MKQAIVIVADNGSWFEANDDGSVWAWEPLDLHPFIGIELSTSGLMKPGETGK